MFLVKISLSCLIFSLISITPSSSSSSSSSSGNNQFQFLDVSASLRHARRLLSPKSGHSNAAPPPPIHQPPHSLSLPLVSRSSLPPSDAITNYTSLTLSRLARDEARLRSPLISGLPLDSGEYFARVGIGSPAADLYMTADTGSDVSWIQCLPCLHCYPQSDPFFNPFRSSTYAPLPCFSPPCIALGGGGACPAGVCLYEVLYGDLSYSSGDFATETISFGSSGSVDHVAIGCGHSNGGLFSGAAGLLGLGGGALSLPSQIGATSFSYCLVNRDSTSSSTLDFNSAAPADSVVAPLLRSSPERNTYRYVGLSGILVGGERVRFPASLLEIQSDGSGGVIVDSGTTVSRLRREVYAAVRDAFRSMAAELPEAGGFSLFDTCYDLPSLSAMRVPAVAFEFDGGATLELPPSNYLLAVDGEGRFCFAFAPTTAAMSIIGNVQQQGMRVTYDLANQRIAFSPNKC